MRKAASPWLVLTVALLLPGMGQVLNGQARRGLVMDFYMLLLGTVTYALAAPGTSTVGVLAGGLFVYAISVMDAYRVAVLRKPPTGAHWTPRHCGTTPVRRSRPARHRAASTSRP